MLKKLKNKLLELIHEFNTTELFLEAKARNKLNDCAYADMSVGTVIGLAISLIIIAAVIPSAIELFYSYNTTSIVDNETVGWVIDGEADSKAITLWWLLPFISIAIVLYMIYSRMK